MTVKRAKVRSLDELDPPPDPVPASADTPPGIPPPPVPSPPVARDLEQSRIDLEERQRRWAQERERFERRAKPGELPSAEGDERPDPAPS